MKRNLEVILYPGSTSSTTTLVQNKAAIKRSGTLILKIQPPYQLHIDDPRADHFHQYLCTLDEEFGLDCPSIWIDAIYFRLRSLSTSTPKPTHTNNTLARIYKAHIRSKRNECFYDVDGFADCLDRSNYKTIVNRHLDSEAEFSELQKHNIEFLYVSKPKFDVHGTLEFNVPQAILEMTACAQCLDKDVIRGVLTNGPQWMFLILKLDKGSPICGGVYAQSDEFTILDPVSGKPSREAVGSLTNIMTHWVRHIHEWIGIDDLYGLRGVGYA